MCSSDLCHIADRNAYADRYAYACADRNTYPNRYRIERVADADTDGEFVADQHPSTAQSD